MGHRRSGNGYTLTIFNLDGTFQGARWSGPSEPVEENAATIERCVANSANIEPGTYIATMERHGTGGVQSRIIHVNAPRKNTVRFEDASGVHVGV